MLAVSDPGKVADVRSGCAPCWLQMPLDSDGSIERPPTWQKVLHRNVNLDMAIDVLPLVVLNRSGLSCFYWQVLSCRSSEQLRQPGSIPMPAQQP